MTDEKTSSYGDQAAGGKPEERWTKNCCSDRDSVCDNEDGIQKMGNLAVTGKETHLAAFPYVGGSYSGTGDLFASVLAGGLARGENLKSMMELAGSFIEKAITDAVKEEIPRNDGVEYEKNICIC